MRAERGMFFLLSGVFVATTCAELTANDRHFVAPLDKTAEIDYSKSVESALMLSQCHPEADGFFGGTFGEPAIFLYAFAMDSFVNADIASALEAVREHVIDTLVVNTFPDVCSYRELSKNKNKLDGRVTGFKFSLDLKADRKRKS